ncbi:MAG: hypothetical protein Q7R66_13380 [Undibacterium sp.]|uniref:hypothetical protein n=1 Tax=Undibacterium sp. TaxID=1914977 RepID=UPI00271EEB8C|nr:hypothetical protein [Undibacterium sp.]MDO8653171.1 hypothetical protein [Undibacterium sp.]
MLHHDGYEFHDIDKKQYRYIGKIEIAQKLIKWTAELTFEDASKGSISGTISGIGDDEGPVRRAVDVAVKAKIQLMTGL